MHEETITQPLTSVTSSDGTMIGIHRSGDGPPAVFLHGTSGSGSNWIPLAGFLKGDLTLHVVDRRGRGRSGLGEPYAFDREVEDVAAVVDAIGEPAHLVGHSFGAILALAAAQVGVPARSLVLYEPPLAAAERLPVNELVEECEASLDNGDPEGCVAAFYQAIGEEQMLEMLRQIPPVYEEMLRNAPTIPRELRSTDRFGEVLNGGAETPTLLLVGSETHPMLRDSIKQAQERLPHAEMRVLDGQGHLAHAMAPEAFARHVLDFVRRH